MTGLLSPMRYAQVIYLTAPAARPVVTRAAASLPPGDQARVVVRELPAAAFTPEPRDERVVLAEADRVPVAAPQDDQSRRVAAARRPRRRGVAGHAGGGDRVRGGVAAGLAAGAAAPDRRLGAAPGRGLAGHPGGAAGWLAAGRADPGAGVGARLVPPGRRRTWPGRSCCWPRSRSRPGWRWPRWRGRGGTTPSPPGWAGSWPPRRSPSTPASGSGRSAPPGA